MKLKPYRVEKKNGRLCVMQGDKQVRRFVGPNAAESFCNRFNEQAIREHKLEMPVGEFRVESKHGRFYVMRGVKDIIDFNNYSTAQNYCDHYNKKYSDKLEKEKTIANIDLIFSDET